jgi:aminopeptidase N
MASTSGTNTKYGRDAADFGLQEDFAAYQNEYYGAYGENPTIINYHYEKDEKMFNAHAYQKGGRVLHMLRKYTGDTAFFKALNQYLVKYRFGTAELSNLRMEFEEVTGEDLNWFFNQWFHRSGHPDLGISHNYDSSGKSAGAHRQSIPGISRSVHSAGCSRYLYRGKS